jgi:hypothetical protein
MDNMGARRTSAAANASDGMTGGPSRAAAIRAAVLRAPMV